MECQLGFFNRPWNEWSFERALEGIAGSGAKYVGLMRQEGRFLLTADSTEQEVEELSGTIAKYGLKFLVSLQAVELDLPLQEAVTRLKRTIDNIARMGGKYFLTTGCMDPEKYDRYFEVISACTDYAAEKGIMIVLKPHGGLSATSKECREAVERVGSENFRIWYDPGNVLWYTGTRPEEDVKGIAEYVTGVCVKDCRTGEDRTVMITPGEGEVDFTEVFRILRDAGFSGPCIVETLGGGTPEEVDAEAKKAVAFLEEILSAL